MKLFVKTNSLAEKKLNLLTDNKGFSLAEIMIVLVIIGGILGIIIPKVLSAADESKVKNTRVQLGEIDNKINEFQSECNGQLPSSLQFMVEDSADCKNWTSSKHSKSLLKDQWGNDFVYESSGNGYNLKSLGKDKKEGGESFAKDLYSQGSSDSQEE